MSKDDLCLTAKITLKNAGKTNTINDEIDFTAIDSKIQSYITEIAEIMADKTDRMVYKAIQDGFLYIVNHEETNEFDKETGVYTKKKVMFPTKTEPISRNLDTLYLEPLIDKMKEFEIDYINTSFEEAMKIFKEKLTK